MDVISSSRVKLEGKIAADERPRQGYASSSKSLFERKAQEASETGTARLKPIEQEKELFSGTSSRRHTFEKAAAEEVRKAAPKIKIDEEEVDLSGRAKSHKQLFEEQAKLSAQVSPSLPRKIFSEQDGEVDISGKAKSKKEMFEKFASEHKGTSPGAERKFLGDVDLSGRAKAHRNIFQQKIEEESQVRTSHKKHLEEDVFTGKASSRRQMFEKFGSGESGSQKGSRTPAEEEQIDLTGRAKSHRQRFEQFAEEASMVKTAQSRSDDLDLSGKALSHKEYFDEKVAEAAKTKTAEKKLRDEEEEAIMGRARLHKLSFEEKAAKDLEVQTCDKSRLEEIPDRASKKKSKKEKHGDEHEKKKKRRRSSSKSKEHKESVSHEVNPEEKSGADFQEAEKAEVEEVADEKEEEVTEETFVKEDEEVGNEYEDDHKVNGKVDGSDEEEHEELEPVNELNNESEIQVAASATYESSAPRIVDENSAEDTTSKEDHVPSKVEEAPKPADSDAVDNKSIPMDYRARRALRQKQKDAERGETINTYTCIIFLRNCWFLMYKMFKRMR